MTALQQRKTVRAWMDASGQQRLILAVIFDEDKYWYTAAWVHDGIWSQLQRRGDHQIGVRDMMAVILLFETFQHKVQENMMLVWIDNKGVLGTLRKGASKCMEPPASCRPKHLHNRRPKGRPSRNILPRTLHRHALG